MGWWDLTGVGGAGGGEIWVMVVTDAGSRLRHLPTQYLRPSPTPGTSPDFGGLASWGLCSTTSISGVLEAEVVHRCAIRHVLSPSCRDEEHLNVFPVPAASRLAANECTCAGSAGHRSGI